MSEGSRVREDARGLKHGLAVITRGQGEPSRVREDARGLKPPLRLQPRHRRPSRVREDARGLKQ